MRASETMVQDKRLEKVKRTMEKACDDDDDHDDEAPRGRDEGANAYLVHVKCIFVTVAFTCECRGL